MTVRDLLIGFGKRRYRRLDFRADWWRDFVTWLVKGGTFRRIREERLRARRT